MKIYWLFFLVFFLPCCKNRNTSDNTQSNRTKKIDTAYYVFTKNDSYRTLYCSWKKDGDTIGIYEFKTENQIQTIEIYHQWYTGAGEATAINLVDIPDFLADSVAYYWKKYGIFTAPYNLKLIGTKASIEKLYGYSHPIFYKGKQYYKRGKHINNFKEYQPKNYENFEDTNFIYKST